MLSHLKHQKKTSHIQECSWTYFHMVKVKINGFETDITIDL